VQYIRCRPSSRRTSPGELLSSPIRIRAAGAVGDRSKFTVPKPVRTITPLMPFMLVPAFPAKSIFA